MQRGGTSSLSLKVSRNPLPSMFFVLVPVEVVHVHLARGRLAGSVGCWLDCYFQGGCSGAGAHWIAADSESAELAVEAAPMLAAQVPWDTGRSPVLHNET